MKKFYSIILIIMALSLGTSCSKPPTNDVAKLGDSVETSIITTTTEPVTEATTTEFVYPNLNEDVFEDNTLEIYHTDFKPSKELESEIMEFINNYGTTCSLYMVNLEDYATFGYNSDTYISTASTIKCPFAFYCYKEIEKGNYSFDDTILYKSGYYSSGTGVLKDNGSGSYYTIRDLLYYTIHYSDNVAFLMLQDHFGYEGYNKMMSDYGFETFLNDEIKWGKLSSHALGYIWTEIYKYKDQCEEGAIFYDTLVNAGSNFLIWPFTEAGYNYKIAHKSGWASPGYHDSGIVLSEHPFVIVVMTDSDGETRDSSFFYNIVLKLNELHDEYLVYLGQEPSSTAPAETTTIETTETTTTEVTTTEITTTVETTQTTTTEVIFTTEEVATTIEVVSEETSYNDGNDYIDSITELVTIENPPQYFIPDDNPIDTYTYQDDSQVTDRYQQYEDDNLYF